jgi:hypothetical protein
LGLAAATLAAFCLMTSMHERYAFATLIFLAPLLDRRPVQVAWGSLAVAVSFNVFAGAPPDQIGPIIPIAGPIGTAGSVAMILSAVIVFVLLVRERRNASADAAERPGVA